MNVGRGEDHGSGYYAGAFTATVRSDIGRWRGGTVAL